MNAWTFTGRYSVGIASDHLMRSRTEPTVAGAAGVAGVGATGPLEKSSSNRFVDAAGYT
jgi:hypothetical protein